jgi:phosphomannomutase
MNEKIFKAYDIRGIYPTEINEQDVYRITKAYCQFLKPKKIVIGCDVRFSSPALKKAAIKAVTELGIGVADVGTISTDMLYFAVADGGYDGGFSITASHNPKEYNGIKFVREQSKPISSDTGLFEIRDLAMQNDSEIPDFDLTKNEKILVEQKNIKDGYLTKIKTFADFSKFKELRIVANANFGMAGKAMKKLLSGTNIKIIPLNFEPDGNFPKGRPDPLIPQNREEISKRVAEEKADLGVAWDADADRCFFFTEKGEFIEGYFITALLAKIFLEKSSGAKIIHDPRLIWAIKDTASQNGGRNIISKSGHSFIKEKMRLEDAIFGGEMSAHYYFRDYWYCDNGMIPLVMILEFLSTQTKTFSEIMNELFWQKYFVSGEINNEVPDVKVALEKAEKKYSSESPVVNKIDGLSMEFSQWRFNLRGSNTEPVIRLNVEAKTKELMEQKRDELLVLIHS